MSRIGFCHRSTPIVFATLVGLLVTGTSTATAHRNPVARLRSGSEIRSEPIRVINLSREDHSEPTTYNACYVRRRVLPSDRAILNVAPSFVPYYVGLEIWTASVVGTATIGDIQTLKDAFPHVTIQVSNRVPLGVAYRIGGRHGSSRHCLFRVGVGTVFSKTEAYTVLKRPIDLLREKKPEMNSVQQLDAWYMSAYERNDSGDLGGGKSIRFPKSRFALFQKLWSGRRTQEAIPSSAVQVPTLDAVFNRIAHSMRDMPESPHVEGITAKLNVLTEHLRSHSGSSGPALLGPKNAAVLDALARDLQTANRSHEIVVESRRMLSSIEKLDLHPTGGGLKPEPADPSQRILENIDDVLMTGLETARAYHLEQQAKHELTLKVLDKAAAISSD